MSGALFDAGAMVATPGALYALADAGLDALALLRRHLAGDWGEMEGSDRILNQRALQDGSRIFSAYVLPTQVKVWVITDAADGGGRRRATTLLLPDEY